MAFHPESYQHFLDRESLMRVRAVQWFERLSRSLVAEDLDQDLLWLQLSDNVELSARSFPELHRALDRAREMLGLEVRPRLFLDSRPEPHSVSAGADPAAAGDPLLVRFAKRLHDAARGTAFFAGDPADGALGETAANESADHND